MALRGAYSTTVWYRKNLIPVILCVLASLAYSITKLDEIAEENEEGPFSLLVMLIHCALALLFVSIELGKYFPGMTCQNHTTDFKIK